MLFEKYRPKTLDEIVGLDDVTKRIKEFLNSPDGIPHLMFSGNPGGGKTTVAKIIGTMALGNALGDFYEFNASNDRGIEFIRTSITEIAKRKPLACKYKIILMDEADNITDDAQAAFRRILEQYSQNCRFIFTCNYPNKIIEAIRSRFVKFEFKKPTPEMILKVLKKVSESEGMKLSEDQLKKYAENAKGDFRNALTILEGQTETGNTGEAWKTMTIAELRKLPVDKRIELAFLGDADAIFSRIWECTQNESAWSLVPLLCDCQHKMNMTMHKHLFLINMLRQLA